MGAQRRIPNDFARNKRKCIRRTSCDTITAVITHIDGLWVMAAFALVVTPLQENHQPVTGTIDTREIQNFADCRCSRI